jgi:hypothetical protein
MEKKKIKQQNLTDKFNFSAITQNFKRAYI